MYSLRARQLFKKIRFDVRGTELPGCDVLRERERERERLINRQMDDQKNIDNAVEFDERLSLAPQNYISRDTNKRRGRRTRCISIGFAVDAVFHYFQPAHLVYGECMLKLDST